MHILENFKSFAKAEIELFNPLTILIGPNGVGKTNLIEGIELFSKIAWGQKSYEISESDAGNAGIAIRGGLKACTRNRKTRLQFGFTGRYFSSRKTCYKGNTPFDYSVVVSTKPEPIIIEEKITLGCFENVYTRNFMFFS